MAEQRCNMGFDFGLQSLDTRYPVKFRWIFNIDGVSGSSTTSSSGVYALPPTKSARPSFSFKEMEIKHLTESVFVPVRPEFKPINLVLYDIKTDSNPVFSWISEVYDATSGKWNAIADTGVNFIRNATLTLYSGCGEPLEEIVFESCWPQAVNWGELDMGSSEVVTVDVTLRYTRAYFNFGQAITNSTASNNGLINGGSTGTTTPPGGTFGPAPVGTPAF
jgi:hypothetical protein